MERKRAGARTGKSEATTSDRSQETLQLPLRVTIVRPPVGVQFCIQGRNRDELVGRAVSAGDDLSFDLDIRVAHGKSGPPRFLGPFTHGTPEERFLYLRGDACWAAGLLLDAARQGPSLRHYSETHRAGTPDGSRETGGPPLGGGQRWWTCMRVSNSTRWWLAVDPVSRSGVSDHLPTLPVATCRRCVCGS